MLRRSRITIRWRGGATGPPRGTLASPYRQPGMFDPEEVGMLGEVFEDVIRALGLEDRADPFTEVVAKTLIEFAQAGEREPARLKQSNLTAIGA
jgi:hypothetical protein